MAAAETTVVGIDLGTSAVKVLATTVGGRIIASGSEFYGLITPEADRVEQDADVVYDATMRVLAAVIGETRLRGVAIAAIGISSAMHGVLCVDADGTPLSHVMTWMDRRSAALATTWRSDGTGATLYAQTGAPMHAMLPLTKIAWLAQNDAALFARAHRFVGLKELLVFRWTGEWLVDWGIAAATGLFDFRSHAWAPDALERAQISAPRLSMPVKPSTTLRTFRASVASELGISDVALVLASSDGALATIGIGSQAGDLAVTLGTSGAVRTLRDAPALDAHGRTFCYLADDTRFIVGGPTSSAGASLDWIFGLLLDELPKAARFARAAALAADVAAGAKGVTVLPFLAGERAPYWTTALRGAVVGLDLAHDRATIIRAAFESVVFGLRAVYDVLHDHIGTANRLLLSGGLTKAVLVRELLADVFELPAVHPHQQEASALGAALVAAQAVALIPDAIAAAHGMGYDTPSEPNAARVTSYRTAYTRYRRIVEDALRW